MKYLLTLLLGAVSLGAALAQAPKRASSPVAVPKFDAKPPQPRSLYERSGVPMWQDSTGTEHDLLAGSGGTLTSVPTRPTGDSTTAPANTEFVKKQQYAKEASVALRLSAKENAANKVSSLTGSTDPATEFPTVFAVYDYLTEVEEPYLRNRVNHTGQQPSSTISDFTEAAQDAVGGGLSAEFTYNDAGNSIAINAIAATKITEDAARRFVTDANKTDWTAGYNDRIVSAGVSGTTNKTLTLTQADGGTVSTTFTDNNSGDMSKATYDGNNNNVVDNAEAVGGIAPANLATKTGTETLDNKFIRSASEVAINTVGGAGYKLDVNGPARLGAGSVTVAPASADSSSAIPTSEWVKQQGYAKEASVALRLTGKADTGHGHVSGNISDFDEAVEDKIGTKIVQGTGISISYNDATGNTTISSTAGGGNMSTSTYDPGNNGVVDNSEALGGVAASSYATKTGTETLTNKTIDGASNTFQNIPQAAVTNLFNDLAARWPLAPSVNAAAGIGRGLQYTGTVAATANNDVLVGVELSPTLNAGAFTGVARYALRSNASIQITSGGMYLPNGGDLGFGTNSVRLIGSSSNNTLDFYTSSTAGGRIFSDGNWLLQTAGGYTNNGYKLDVQGSVRSTGIVYADNDIYLTANAKYLWGKNSSGVNTRMLGINASNNLYVGSVDAAINSLIFSANSTTLGTWSSGGNLTVTGTIGASNLSGTNTGDQTSVSGNAGTATALQTARTIGISGKATGTATSFNGSANITIPITAVTLLESDIPALTVPKISGTKAQYNTSVTDGDFLFVGDVTGYTDEAVDDRVAALLQPGTGLTWSYNDASGTLTPTVTITQYTDELAQDAVSLLMQNGGGITWTYNDALNTLTPSLSLSGFSTANLSEGTALYFTDERAQDAVGGGLSAEFTYNDAGNSIAINAIAATKITTDASNRFMTDTEKSNAAAGYNDRIVSAGVSGTTNKTLTLTQADGGTVSTTFTDLDSGGGGSSTPTDDVFRVRDDGDNTKQLAFQLSGVSTGTTRTATVPNVNGTMVLMNSLSSNDYDANGTYGLISLNKLGVGSAASAGYGVDLNPTGGMRVSSSLTLTNDVVATGTNVDLDGVTNVYVPTVATTDNSTAAASTANVEAKIAAKLPQEIFISADQASINTATNITDLVTPGNLATNAQYRVTGNIYFTSNSSTVSCQLSFVLPTGSNMLNGSLLLNNTSSTLTQYQVTAGSTFYGPSTQWQATNGKRGYTVDLAFTTGATAGVFQVQSQKNGGTGSCTAHRGSGLQIIRQN